MLRKLKSSMLLLPLVVWVGSTFGPSEFSWNRQFKHSTEIEEAILNYVEGVYIADSCRIYDSVHRGVVIRGTCAIEEGEQEDPAEVRSVKDLITHHGTANSSHLPGRVPAAKKIVIYDVQENTATARLTAAWGTEYIHLARIEGKWYLVNILCQPLAPHPGRWSSMV